MGVKEEIQKSIVVRQVCDSYSNLPHSYCASSQDQEASPTSLMGDYSFLVEEYEVLVPVQT